MLYALKFVFFLQPQFLVLDDGDHGYDHPIRRSRPADKRF